MSLQFTILTKQIPIPLGHRRSRALESIERIQKTDPGAPAPEAVERAVHVLDNGGLVVAPTETRYGLLARADNQPSMERLLAVKGRLPNKPVSVFVGNVEMIMHYGQLNPQAQILARVFLPGPLTLVVPAIGVWHSSIAPHGLVGIRVSSSPVIQAIMERVDYPVTATSANLSGEADSEGIEEIVQAFGENVDLYLDAGRLAGEPSTVVDCSAGQARILRSGAITAAQIENALRK